MKITLTLSDADCEALTGREEPTATEVATAITTRLPMLRQVRPQDRICVLLPEERRDLERLLEIGSLERGTQLLARLKPLLQVVTGPIALELTPSELDRLNAQAAFMGQDPHDYLRATMREVLNESALRY